MSILIPVISALSPIVSDLIDRAFPDSEKREQAKLDTMAKIQEQINALDLAQMEVNKAEASHSSMFVAGARPFVMWVCGIAFAYHYVLQPLLAFILANTGHDVVLPAFDMETLATVLMGMLGLGGLRSYDKLQGIDTKIVKLPWLKK